MLQFTLLDFSKQLVYSLIISLFFNGYLFISCTSKSVLVVNYLANIPVWLIVNVLYLTFFSSFPCYAKHKNMAVLSLGSGSGYFGRAWSEHQDLALNGHLKPWIFSRKI